MSNRFFLYTLFFLSTLVFSCQQNNSSIRTKTSETNRNSMVFNKYNFEDKKHIVLGLIWGGKDEHGITKEFGEFYIDDIDVLNELKLDWYFDEAGSPHACGYHYNFEVVTNKKSVESMLINLDCNDISTNQGHYYFDIEKFDVIRNRIKPVYSDRKKFESIENARAYLNEIENSKELLLLYQKKPTWADFEGRFSVIYTDINEPTEEVILKSFDDYLQQNHPKEKYALHINGRATGGDYFIEVKCDKTMYDSFNFKDYKPWGTWDNENLILTSYWKTNPN